MIKGLLTIEHFKQLIFVPSRILHGNLCTVDKWAEHAIGIVGYGHLQLIEPTITVKDDGSGKFTFAGRRKLNLFMKIKYDINYPYYGITINYIKNQFYNFPILFKNLRVFGFNL